MVYTVTDSKVTPHYQKLKNKKASAGDSSAVRRTKYSRGPEFDSQYPQDTSQPSVTPVPISCLLLISGDQAHTWYT